MTKISRKSLIVLAALLGIGACGQQKSQPGGAAEKITLAVTTSDLGSLVYIAKELGYFKDNGLEITINEYEAGKLAAEALVAGKADVATASDFAFVSFSFDNPDLRTFGTITTARTIKMISRKDHGIEEPQDLMAKRIGITRKSSGEFYLGRFLTFSGLSISDVEIVDLKPTEIAEALVKGDLDAALTWEPHIYNMQKKLGESVTVWPGQSEQDLYFLLITTEDWLKDHASTARRLLKALIDAEQFVSNSEQKAKDIIKNKFGYTPEYVDYYWARRHYSVSFHQALLLAMEDQARWRIENKLTDSSQVPNYLDYLYIDGLKALKPQAVTVIH